MTGASGVGQREVQARLSGRSALLVVFDVRWTTNPNRGRHVIDVSILICTYNRRAALRALLDSLTRADSVGVAPWEVIVVDNNSSDTTRETVATFEAADALPLRYVVEERQGLSHARNRGISESRGSIIAFLDDDVLVDEQWLRRLIDAFDDVGIGAVGGRVRLNASPPRPAWWIADAYDGKVGAFDRGEDPYILPEDGSGMIGIGANLAFRREALEAAGAFHPDLGRNAGNLGMGEDLDMVRRVHAAGWTALYDPLVRVVHCPGPDRFTRPYLRRFMYQIGRWEWDLGHERFQTHAQIAGVPRWLVRRAAGEVTRMAAAFVRLDATRRTFEYLRLLRTIGTLRRCRESQPSNAKRRRAEHREEERQALQMDAERRAAE